jgi:hypothetical protein
MNKFKPFWCPGQRVPGVVKRRRQGDESHEEWGGEKKWGESGGWTVAAKPVEEACG